MTATTEPTSVTETTTTRLVEPDWLVEHLGDPNLAVVEVDVSRAAYAEGHIEGATLWNIYADLKTGDYRPTDRATLEAILTRSGISPTSTVVFYGYAPAFGMWLLTSHGHADARILDCSRDTWQAGARPWSSEVAVPEPTSYHLGEADRRLSVDAAGLMAVLGRPNVSVVDVRSAAEFQGERFWPSGGMQPGGRAGHIPGALHQPLDGYYRPDGSFRAAGELRSLLSAIDVDGTRELVTYCTIGGRAATAWFVLTQLLGRDGVRVYDGSWAEWGCLPDAPVE